VAIGLAALLPCGPTTSSTLARAVSKTAVPDAVALTPVQTTTPATPTRRRPRRQWLPPFNMPQPSGAAPIPPPLQRGPQARAGRPISTVSYNLTVNIWGATSANGKLVWIVTQRRLSSNCCLPAQLNLAGGAWTVQGPVSNGFFTRWVDFRSDPGLP